MSQSAIPMDIAVGLLIDCSLMWKVPAHCEQSHPWAGDLGIYRYIDVYTHKNQNKNQEEFLGGT